MRNPLCILAVCMVWLFVEESLALSKSINTLRETERLAEHLNRGAFTAVQNVAKTVEPFFSVFSSVIQMVVDIRSATSPSAELEYLHQLSDSINQKFDEVNSQFDEIKKLIKWTSVQATYASLEANIHAVFDQFKLIFKVPSSGMNQQKQLFISSYESTYQDSGSKLFAGFMLDTGLVSQGLLRPAMHYTENNRGEMRTFMLGIMKLLILGANVELGYMTIKGYDNVIPFHSHEWQVKFEQVQEKMKEIDLEMKNNYQAQAMKDIDTFSNKNFELSNPMFGRYLYQELSKKYFWRDWLVVVSTHTGYNHDTYSRSCNGVVTSTHRTKDLVVDSVDKDIPPLDIQSVRKQRCASLQQSCQNTVQYYPCNDDPTATHRRSRRCGTYYSENADVVFNWITNIGSSCSPISSYGVINTGKNPMYYTSLSDDSQNRLFVCDLGVCKYYVHFFG
uniref:Uncharacterized protein LOC111131072 n=1 Tax=Crassostrea virginica TaxID=6565 RepID=A0A8B8E329_CRAVI|nr:uncharacterized protein LOC111131072 [Crassostrea virginica]